MARAGALGSDSDDSIFGVVELHSIRVRLCAPGVRSWARVKVTGSSRPILLKNSSPGLRQCCRRISAKKTNCRRSALRRTRALSTSDGSVWCPLEFPLDSEAVKPGEVFDRAVEMSSSTE
jgi:hypothetical protein